MGECLFFLWLGNLFFQLERKKDKIIVMHLFLLLWFVRIDSKVEDNTLSKFETRSKNDVTDIWDISANLHTYYCVLKLK